MSVAISVLTIEARNEDGDYIEIKLNGFTTPPTDEQVELAKTKAAELFGWAFGEAPDDILVHDAMKFRAERPGEEGYKDA